MASDLLATKPRNLPCAFTGAEKGGNWEAGALHHVTHSHTHTRRQNTRNAQGHFIHGPSIASLISTVPSAPLFTGMVAVSVDVMPADRKRQHGRRPAQRHTDNTARHGAACSWNNMAVRARPRMLLRTQHRPSKSKSKGACDLDTLSNKKQPACSYSIL